MYQQILIALEGKSTDEAAIAHAAALAQQLSAGVTLLRVVTIAADGGDGMERHWQLEPGSGGWRRKNQAEATLAALENRLRKSGLAVKTALVIGDRSEADEIVAFADEGKYDLIVLASDGHPWWKRALFGCLADGVHHTATVPTLLVSDGTRRAKVALKHAPVVNPILAAFGRTGV